ncbi:MAG TPA: ABC transporter permease [Galbitalea sp.]|jgi:rhamnose transport system permease protein|nr:ABC transporter permease [Galbitalea sp.]
MTATELKGTPVRDYLLHDKPFWRRILQSREAGLIGALVVVVVLSISFVPNFGQPITLTYLVQTNFPIFVMLLPMTLIVVAGEIDLSVGSVLGVSSVVFGLLYDAKFSLVLAAIIAVLIGAGIGAFNGFLVTVVGLPSLAVTIGTLALFRGVAVGLLGTTAITDFPVDITTNLQNTIGASPFPILTIPFVILTIIFIVILQFTSFGRGIYAIGLGHETAHFSGVTVQRTKFVLYVISGLVAAAVGVVFTLEYDNSIGSNGIGDELLVVTAVVLGGVSTFGGRGTVLGAIVGGLLIAVLTSALQLAGVGSNGISVVTGSALILSVIGSRVLEGLTRGRREKKIAAAIGGE